VDALDAGNINRLTQESLIKHHAILVKRIAYHLSGRLPQSVQIDDLIQAGMVGLLEAARNYDSEKGASFETYANIRIRGHMLDEVRRNDWVPRSVYRNARVISDAVKQVENRYGREAKDIEIASELGIELSEYHDMLNDTAGSQVFAFEDLGVTEDVIKKQSEEAHTEPYGHLLHEDLKQQLTAIIDSLPAKEKLVLSLYYEQELNLKEIGDILDVSESRVSQIHTQAILRVKSRLPE